MELAPHYLRPGSLARRVYGNPHTIIRKYGLMCCRQCFRSNAKDSGFIKGLLMVTEKGVTVLASYVNGSRISLADDVIAATDGCVYFSVASTKFGIYDWFLDLLEEKPHGQLLKYDPSLNETSILLEGLGLASGVTLSKNENYLVVCVTWKFRCLKYWLKGEHKGETEIFIKNLSGGPDNINLAPYGSI